MNGTDFRQICRFGIVALGAAIVTASSHAATATRPIGDAHSVTASQFAEPEAARFRNESVIGNAVCGEVNSKNTFGGYVGYRPYVFVTRTRQAFVTPAGDAPAIAGAGIMSKQGRAWAEWWGARCRFVMHYTDSCVSPSAETESLRKTCAGILRTDAAYRAMR